MNEKANVSKELNANHRKILESLLKLPENRECADCKSNMPIQLLYDHDTAMGNERSNNYWEAELPPNYDRVGIEFFIRAKYDFVELPVSSIDIFSNLMLKLRILMLNVRYEEKRWVPRDGKAKSLSRVNGEKIPTRRGGHGRMNDTNHRKITCPPVTKSSTPLPVKVSTPLPVKASSPLLAKASTPMAVKASQKNMGQKKKVKANNFHGNNKEDPPTGTRVTIWHPLEKWANLYASQPHPFEDQDLLYRPLVHPHLIHTALTCMYYGILDPFQV
uniref:Uncharacterized protein n=1 Tax=Salix viminalis TaxID=40686 RepID=A0A6N2KYE6_SALVM